MTSGSYNLTLRRGTRQWRCVGLLAIGHIQWLTALGLRRHQKGGGV